MASLEINFDNSDFRHLEARFHAAGNQAPHAIRRALNHTGDKTRTQMIRALTAQTGLQRKTIAKAVRVKRANYGALAYVLETKGGNIRLKFFKARETRKGVSAAPWNHRQVFGGTFIKGGRFPQRVALALGGQVFRRVGKGRLPIAGVRSGLFIPTEMGKGASAAAFDDTTKRELVPRVERELMAILGGMAPRG